MKKIAIVTTHPIQYNAPWFKLLANEAAIDVKVFYTWSQVATKEKFDPGFGKIINWDINLLEGYPYVFVKNSATNPGSHHRKGIINPTLIFEIEQWQPDTLLVFGWNFVSHFKCLKYFHKKMPVLFRGDSTLIDETFGLKTFLRRIYLRWIYSFVDFAFYVGQNNKQYFIKHGLQQQQLIYAPHATDNGRFAQPDDDYQQQAQLLKSQLGIKPTDIVILFAGKFEEKKNPFFLLDFLKHCTNPTLKLLFIGNGKLENVLKEKAGKDNRILFLDFQNQQTMPVVYRLGDVVILPSTGPGETWGLALNEAMACSKMVIASDKVGGAIDLIKNYENGLVISLNNVTPFYELMEKLLADKTIATTYGKKSFEIINEFSYSKIVNAFSLFIHQKNK